MNFTTPLKLKCGELVGHVPTHWISQGGAEFSRDVSLKVDQEQEGNYVPSLSRSYVYQ